MRRAGWWLARRLGATHTVAAGEGSAVEAVREITRGGVDYAFEAVGNAKVLSQAYAATRRGGTTVTIGLPDPGQRLDLQAVSFVAEERTLLGSYMGSAVPQRDISRLLDLYLAGRLPVDELVSRQVELPSVNAAFDALREGAVVRKLLCF